MATAHTLSAVLFDVLDEFAVSNERMEILAKRESDFSARTAHDRRVKGSERKTGLLFLEKLAE